MIYVYLTVSLFFFIQKKYFYGYIDIEQKQFMFFATNIFLCFCSENINRQC